MRSCPSNGDKKLLRFDGSSATIETAVSRARQLPIFVRLQWKISEAICCQLTALQVSMKGEHHAVLNSSGVKKCLGYDMRACLICRPELS